MEAQVTGLGQDPQVGGNTQEEQGESKHSISPKI